MVHFGGNAEQFGLVKNNLKRLTNELAVKPALISAGSTYYFVTIIDNEEFVLPVISNNNSSKKASNDLQPASAIIEIKRYSKEY
ncbi:hypothetical protein [Desulfitobacterium sp. PCE1]|uniref:hypothetical protein n=1 Tax=Desulfitobacterium sp. PCE1 TaxID=146907 RepID=UPI00036AC2A9|nr:hypothetical protein [Desulfitobacterium sp. PCE1]